MAERTQNNYVTILWKYPTREIKAESEYDPSHQRVHMGKAWESFSEEGSR